MTLFSILTVLFFTLLFFFAVFIAFYIPGNLSLQKLSLTSFQKIVLSIIVGMAFWGWQGFVFGFLGIRWMTYIYLLLLIILWLRSDDSKKVQYVTKRFQQNLLLKIDTLLLFIVALGTLLQLVSIFFMGFVGKTGMYFCCAIPDSLYHIALTNQLVNQVPPTEPGMAGVVVHNYHYLSNLVAADLIRIFHLPLIATQFQYFVVLLSLLLGLAAIVFGQILHMKKSYIRWLVFFLYFSGDLTYLLSFLAGKGINFTTPFLENALWLWISPPRVFAAVIYFAGLSLLALWIKQKRMLVGIPMAFVLASLVSFKIYDGIFMAAGVVALFVYFAFTKQFRMLLPLLLTGILSLIFYLPVNIHSGGLVFTSTWRIENFVVQPGLGIQHFELAREIYASHHNWFGVTRFEILFFILYIVFVFGTIILGIFQTKKSLSLFPRELNIFLLSGIGVNAILGLFFIQQSGGANSSQFLITVDILGSIYAALACYYWVEKFKDAVKYIAILLIVLLTIPRVINTGYADTVKLLHNSLFTIDNNQLQALRYLNMNTPPSAIILADNLDREQPYKSNPKSNKIAVPLTDNRSYVGNLSYYISFLANRTLFIDGDSYTNSIVESHGVDITKRVNIERTIFLNKSPFLIEDLLHQNNITYVYLGSNTLLAKNPPSFMDVVFKNTEISILKVHTNL